MVSVIAVGALLPWTRPMFLNNHYATLSGAVVASMLVIPLQTVIPEELAFRGALHGALHRAWGFRGVAAAGSLLFGLWHVATSLGLTSSNVGFTRLFGGGFLGMSAGVTLAVLATGAAGFVFSWLRRRSGSLIAPIALHWSLNGSAPSPPPWCGSCRPEPFSEAPTDHTTSTAAPATRSAARSASARSASPSEYSGEVTVRWCAAAKSRKSRASARVFEVTDRIRRS